MYKFFIENSARRSSRMDDVQSPYSGEATTEQKERLIDFIEQNRIIVSKKTLPRYKLKKLWIQCAQKLNAYSDEGKLTSTQWSKVWSTLQSHVLSKQAEIKETTQKGKSPPDIVKLTPLEKRVWSLILQEEVEEAKNSDPLADNTEAEEIKTIEDNARNSGNVEKNENNAGGNSSTSGANRKRLHTSASGDRDDPPNRRARNSAEGDGDFTDDYDSDDTIAAFLDIEERKLESAQRMTEAVCNIRDQFVIMVEVLSEIRDTVLASVITR